MTDWTILDEPGVKETCHRQARKVAARFRGIVETDDLVQEAYMKVAMNSAVARDYLENDEHGLLAHTLWCDLMDIARAEGTRQSRQVSWEALKAGR